MTTGADILVRQLVAANVSHIFSLSGNQIMPIYNACIGHGIKIIHTRHEGAAVFMADAWAQMTGQIGVALVTAAPGFANALGPLFTARQSEVPLLLISGDSPVNKDGWGAFQEFDQITASAPFTKESIRILSVETLAGVVAEGMQLAAAGRPGPVHLAIPHDVLDTALGQPDASAAAGDPQPSPLPATGSISEIISLLASATHPLLLAGPAVNRALASDVKSQLIHECGLPVIGMESPRGLNDPRLGKLKQVFAQADLIICLGKTVDFTLGFGADSIFAARPDWVVVDADADQLAKAARHLGDRLQISTNANPSGFAASLLESAPDNALRSQWCDLVDAALLTRRPIGRSGPAGQSINSANLCAAIAQQAVQQTSTVICDGGEIGQWAQHYIRGDVEIINGPSGAIGGGLCYAVAAKMAAPDHTVFAIMGDGTVGFHFVEFETAVRENAPFVVIIGNDARWNAEHQIQLRDYGPDRLIGCQLSDARYDLAVEGLGGHGEYVTQLGDLDSAIKRAIASNKPACVNVQIDGLAAPTVVDL
jgi:acetolactate synthase-1/2/3 large subunit